MRIRDWTVCIVEPNKFEAQILVDVLRGAGVEKIKYVTDSAEAMALLEVYPANIIIAAVESLPMDGVAWTRAFRRNHSLRDRKASIFLTSRAFSRSLAEDCRHAGANALIGKPISAKILTATVTKVLANPRPFIDAEKYVGPCRRAGIVTAGEPKKRRKADAEAGAPQTAKLTQVLNELAYAVDAMLVDASAAHATETALSRVQAYAVNAGDGPMMRACAAMNLQLQTRDSRIETARDALNASIAGMKELAALELSKSAERDAIAERVRLAVARARLAAA